VITRPDNTTLYEETKMTDTQVSTREVPWMKIGKLIDEPINARKAARLAGIDFTVSLRELAHAPEQSAEMEGMAPNADWSPIPTRRAIVRDDNEQWLGIASSDYHVLQYAEAFDFMDSVSPRYVAAGSLKNGRQAFMVVKAPKSYQVPVLDGDDPHDMYAVMRTSHDCTRAVEVSVMALRKRCMNQLTLQSFSVGAAFRWSVKHTPSLPAKLEQAKDALRKLDAYAGDFQKTAQRLVNAEVSNDRARAMLTRILPDRPARDEKIEAIMTLFTTADTVGYHGTGWALVNAVSEYYDWYRRGGSPESRFVAALEGQTQRAINRTASYVLSDAR
jgi:phage/plasmid-like protein (TIGR03299 family)